MVQPIDMRYYESDSRRSQSAMGSGARQLPGSYGLLQEEAVQRALSANKNASFSE